MTEKLTMRTLWAIFALAAVVFGFQFSSGLDNIFAGRGTLTIDAEAGTVLLRWRGSIEAPMLARLDEAFRAHRDNQARFVLALASPGGKVDHGADVVRLIKAMQRTHAVDTVVEGRSVCASMCVPVTSPAADARRHPRRGSCSTR